MKTSEAFRLTKSHVSTTGRTHGSSKWGNDDGKEQFICIAAYGLRSGGVSRIIKPIIKKLLDGHTTLEDWLDDKHKIHEVHVQCARYQETRHAWLDHLIAHYEALGD